MIGPLYDRGYFISIVYSGSFLVVFGTMMQSLCSQYWQLMLSQAITVGIGTGVIYVPSLAVVSEAFTEKRALAIGVPSTGAGIGTDVCLPDGAKMLMIEVIGGIIYPILFRRLQPMVGFPWATRIVGFIFLGTFAISYLSFHGISRVGTKPRAMMDSTAFRETHFMIYFLALALIGCGYFVPIFYISVDATTNLDISPDLAFYLLSILNAASVIGRFLPGLLPKVFAAIVTFPLMTAAGGLVVFAWMAVHNLAGLVIFGAVYGIIDGYLITVITIMVPVLSPPGAIHETIGTRIGMAWFGFGIGALIGSPIGGALSDTKAGNFQGAQAFGGAMLFGGAALLIYPWMVVRRRRA